MNKFIEVDIPTVNGEYVWVAKYKVETVKVRKISSIKRYAVEVVMTESFPEWHFEKEKEAYEFAYALIAKLEGEDIEV